MSTLKNGRGAPRKSLFRETGVGDGSALDHRILADIVAKHFSHELDHLRLRDIAGLEARYKISHPVELGLAAAFVDYSKKV